MIKGINEELADAVARAAGITPHEAHTTIELAKQGFGDFASKIAFSLAAKEKKNPVQIASEIAQKIKKSDYIEKIETRGPYINFYLSDAFYADALKEILKEKKKFGIGKKTKKKVMVEFFHANTHKGVHIGHIRTGSLGEALSRIKEFSGDTVIRANFQGDIGPHVAKCLWGFIHLYNKNAPTEKRGVWLGKVYAEASNKVKDNETLENEVKEINRKLYAGDKEITKLWKETRQWCLDDFEKFYKEFGLSFDELYFESETEKVGTKVVHELLAKGIVKRDDGAIVIDLKEDGLGIFVLITKEGYPLYSTKDIGLAKLKFDKYDLDQSIHVVGKEQEHHFKQLFKTFERIGFERAARVSYHLIYELVMLPEGKMSSRTGTMILYEDLRDKLLAITEGEVKKRHADMNETEARDIAKKIALAAIKYSMLSRENNRVITFDWEQALSLEGETGPYLQYAYVRTRGILDKTNEKGRPDKAYRFNDEERALIRQLCEFPLIVEKSAHDLAPHHVANYLTDLAATFNKFYAVSPVLNAEKKEERATRLAVVEATGILLQLGLELLGIECPEKM